MSTQRSLLTLNNKIVIWFVLTMRVLDSEINQDENDPFCIFFLSNSCLLHPFVSKLVSMLTNELYTKCRILNEHHWTLHRVPHSAWTSCGLRVFPRALQSLHAHKLKQVTHHNSKSSTLIFENVPIKKE